MILHFTLLFLCSIVSLSILGCKDTNAVTGEISSGNIDVHIANVQIDQSMIVRVDAFGSESEGLVKSLRIFLRGNIVTKAPTGSEISVRVGEHSSLVKVIGRADQDLERMLLLEFDADGVPLQALGGIGAASVFGWADKEDATFSDYSGEVGNGVSERLIEEMFGPINKGGP